MTFNVAILVYTTAICLKASPGYFWTSWRGLLPACDNRFSAASELRAEDTGADFSSVRWHQRRAYYFMNRGRCSFYVPSEIVPPWMRLEGNKLKLCVCVPAQINLGSYFHETLNQSQDLSIECVPGCLDSARSISARRRTFAAVFCRWLDPESVAFNLCIPASNRTDCMDLLCRWFEDIHDVSPVGFFLPHSQKL